MNERPQEIDLSTGFEAFIYVALVVLLVALWANGVI